MIVRIVVGCVLLAAALAAAPAVNAACRIEVFADLPLQPDPDRAIIKGEVNGRSAVFIADTGAWASTMSYSDARRLGVKVDGSAFSYTGYQVQSAGIGGRQENGAASFNMKLGSIDLPHELMTAIPMRPLDHDAVALVGMDLLAQHDMELDLPDNEIRLVRVNGCAPTQLAYWNKPYSQVKLEADGSGRPSILVNVLLNGHVVPAQIDSGAPQSIVTPEAARAAGVDLHTATVAGEIGGIGSARVDAQVARFDTFTIGDETIRNAKLVVASMWKFNKVDETGTRLGSHTQGLNQARMLLGADFLRAHRVLVTNAMGMMVFSYMGGPIFNADHQQAEKPQAPPAPVPAPSH